VFNNQNELINMSNCFRCNSALIDNTPDDVESGTFYKCSQCESEYIKRPGKSLCDRWGMPITVALYGLILANNTEDNFEHIYDQMLRKGVGFVATLIIHIKFEIKFPKQNVSDMLDFHYLDEVALRGFLVELNVKLLQWYNANRYEIE